MTASIAPASIVPDPRRWWSLAIITASVLIISLDSSVLTVAIPTILRDFHTTLPSLQWVITGYALVFASLLIIGGRIGDIYGHRRAFIIGAAFFGVGSLLATVSQSVPQLIVGESVIEGIGAALMLPNTLALLSTSFVGHERATAFGVWGAVGGAGAALGPVVGGVLTSDLSWRWAFGVNVVIVPFAIVGAMTFIPKGEAKQGRTSLDLPGALLIALGMFSFIFGLSKGPLLGWWHPLRDAVVAGHRVWPSGSPIGVIPAVFVGSAALFFIFFLLERRKERADDSPLFEFGQLRHRGFRIGLGLSVMATVGQTSLGFVLAIFLQGARNLSPQANGLWQLPVGLCVLIGSQIGSYLARRVDLTMLVRVGLFTGTCSLVYVAASLSVTMSYWNLLPGLVAFGLGFGVCMSQVSNIVLSNVDQDKSGVAGGANGTSRQLGLSIGIAVTGALLTASTISGATSRVQGSTVVTPEIKVAAIDSLRAGGVRFGSPSGATAHDVEVLHALFQDSLAHAARSSILVGAGAVGVSFLLSLRLARRGARTDVPHATASELLTH